MKGDKIEILQTLQTKLQDYINDVESVGDSIDFFQQSKFGPHNIKPTIKFAEDNNISIAEAKKILKMEPEDQVLEKTRLQVLKDKGRTRQASGGLTSLTRTTPPERGPNSQGLASFMKNGMK